jgi:hypothetical protein
MFGRFEILGDANGSLEFRTMPLAVIETQRVTFESLCSREGEHGR